jgi:hypothetical protein
MGTIIEFKKEIIKRLRAKIVDQGEMCYEMLDKVNEHKRSAQLMKKRAVDSAYSRVIAGNTCAMFGSALLSNISVAVWRNVLCLT